MRRSARRIGLLAAFFLVCCSWPLAATGDGFDDDGVHATLERQLFEAVNAYRREQGLESLALDDAISASAREHSRAMAEGRVDFGHGGFQERATAIGAKLPLASMAENVSRHRRALEEIPEAALTGWTASDVHRRNLSSDRTLTGIGVARSASGEIFVTQIFVGTQPETAPPP